MRTLILAIPFCLSCLLATAQSPNAARFHWEIGANIGLMPTFAKDRPEMLMMLVFSEVSVSELNKSASSAVSTKDYNKFLVTGFLGARYALNRRWGIQGELGFGAALLNAGISYRFAKPRK